MATVNEDPDGDGVAIVNNLRFQGQYYDSETGLHYNYHRTYDPNIGRYTQPDPIGLRGGYNRFAYVNGNPVGYVDPRGLVKWRGYLESIGAVEWGGAVRYKFNLESECINGRTANMTIIAGGFAVGAGIKLSATVSPVEFDDGYSSFNPSAYEGAAYYLSATVALSLPGVSASYIKLGKVKIRGISPVSGLDLSVISGAGISFVDSIEIRNIK